MNKHEAYHSFWRQFGNAYEETSVPDSATLPYLTYEMPDDSFDRDIAVTASAWDRSASWVSVTSVVDEISQAIGRSGAYVRYDGGAFWIRRGTPWAQRMTDVNDSIRRIVMNVVVEFME